MNIYQNLQAGLQPSKVEVASRQNTLGGWVMIEAEKKGWNTDNHMPQIMDAFYRGLQKFNWRWTPSQACGSLASAAKLLDGGTVNAECQAAANAFMLLLNAPAPHGFDAKSKMVTYSGREMLIGADNGAPTAKEVARREGRGFVARHPFGGEHGLLPNVWDPESDSMADMYSWANHKVVELNGRYWDVCYNASYIYLQQMCVAIVIGTNELTTRTKSLEEAMMQVSEDKVMVKNWMQIAYFRSTTPDQAAYKAGAKSIGPYADSLYGDESTYGKLEAPIKW